MASSFVLFPAKIVPQIQQYTNSRS